MCIKSSTKSRGHPNLLIVSDFLCLKRFRKKEVITAGFELHTNFDEQLAKSF